MKYKIKTFEKLLSNGVRKENGNIENPFSDCIFSTDMRYLCGKEIVSDDGRIDMFRIDPWMCESIENEDDSENDLVNHPKHYTSHPSGIECIDIAQHYNFAIGNAIKYLWRQGLKEGESSEKDLKKAIWYIQNEIKRIKK